MAKREADLKNKLIREGTKLVQKNGINSISLREIAEKCGVTHSTPYCHFKNKNEYLKALVEQISIVFGTFLSKGLEDQMSSRQMLLKMGVNYIEFAQNYPNFFDVLFLSDLKNKIGLQGDQLTSEENLTGFEEFQSVVNRFAADNNLKIKSSIEVVQIWSFIIGLSVIVSKQNICEAELPWITDVIDKMIDTFIKGNQ